MVKLSEGGAYLLNGTEVIECGNDTELSYIDSIV